MWTVVSASHKVSWVFFTASVPRYFKCPVYFHWCPECHCRCPKYCYSMFRVLLLWVSGQLQVYGWKYPMSMNVAASVSSVTAGALNVVTKCPGFCRCECNCRCITAIVLNATNSVLNVTNSVLSVTTSVLSIASITASVQRVKALCYCGTTNTAGVLSFNACFLCVQVPFQIALEDPRRREMLQVWWMRLRRLLTATPGIPHPHPLRRKAIWVRWVRSCLSAEAAPEAAQKSPPHVGLPAPNAPRQKSRLLSMRQVVRPQGQPDASHGSARGRPVWGRYHLCCLRGRYVVAVCTTWLSYKVGRF